MLRPEQIDKLPAAVIAAFEDMEGALKAKAAGALAGPDPDPADVSPGLVLIAKQSEAPIAAAAAKTVADAVKTSSRTDEAVLKAAKVAGLLETYGPVGDSPAVRAVVADGIANVVDFANLVRTSALQAVRRQFTDALDAAMLATATGTVSPADAIRTAIKAIAEMTTTISYRTADGRVIEQSLYGAVRRGVLTGANQTTLRVTEARMDELGVDYVETSAHAGARPEHAVWQGKVFRWPDEFRIRTGYGTGDGLGGWNCRHSFYPFVPSIMEPTDWAVSDRDSVRDYDLSQRQRACERNIRLYQGRASAYSGVLQELTGTGRAPELRAWAREQRDHNAAMAKKWRAEADSVAAKRGGARRRDREVGDPIRRVT